MSITHLYPRPVPVTLGGRTYRVGEMRVIDLIDLQDWLDLQWVNPLDALRDRLGGMDEAERRAALTAIWDDVEAGPSGWGDERANALYGTAGGILKLFCVILRQHHPDLDKDAVIAIAERTSPAEYAALKRAWRRGDPAEEVEWLLGLDPGDRGNPIGWPQVVCEVCEAYGWTLEYAATLTMGQLRAARAGGRPVTRGTVVVPKTNLKSVVAAARRKLFGDTKGAV